MDAVPKIENSTTTDDDEIINSPGILIELGRAAKTGMGMFSESYFIFAVGTVKPVWQNLYPDCYKVGNYCTQETNAITYVEIAGIILSQLTFGWLADCLGRRWGSRLTVSLMTLGAIMCVVSFGTDDSGLFAMFNTAIFVFSMGVGGEYPMAASLASERSGSEGLLRGRTIAFAFANQGWGSFIYACVIGFLLAVTNTLNCTTSSVCDTVGLNLVWRLSYAFGVLILIGLGIYRFTCLPESKMFEERALKYSAEEKEAQRQQRIRNTQLLFSRKYFPRLFGAAVAWFLNDVGFYGNKLFQSTIIAGIIGKATIGQNNNYIILNAAVGLVGYYFAAFTVDSKILSRVRMQIMGFFIIGVVFLICGFAYTQLTSQVGVFLFLYLTTSFFQQFGPNVTTWLVPVDIFPTDIRAQAHGYCAATGKLGALVATLIFTYAGPNQTALGNSTIFIVCGFFSLAGCLVTLLLVPDFNGVQLKEIDRRWSVDRHEFKGGVAA